ncbi:hypothetical protein [Spiroplasma endosymbiont of Labia minor]|uniref:hypothetical protein n=1 Tax=Spiroplasma endosymbiont of Labia minor TaxID=3066305 RepID=UPI0030D13008
MRKITKNLVTLMFIVVLYFGYSAWLGQEAAAHSTEVWYSILDPFKTILLVSLFAMIVPTVKSIFFGTYIGIRRYRAARRDNILFNYESAIDFFTKFNGFVKAGDSKSAKSMLPVFQGLTFKPTFANNYIQDVTDKILVDKSIEMYYQAGEYVLSSIKEMFEKEKKFIRGETNEFLFDIKRGYDYVSFGSKYAINYYWKFENNALTQRQIGWKIFSLEMFKFYVYEIISLFITAIACAIFLPIIAAEIPEWDYGKIAPIVIISMFFIVAIVFHAVSIFAKKHSEFKKRNLIIPAIIYYFLLFILALNIVFGYALIPSITGQNEGSGLQSTFFIFLFSILYVVLSSCLILYVISTLMDAWKNGTMQKGILFEGIIIPMIMWILTAGSRFFGAAISSDGPLQDTIAYLISISIFVLIGYWVVLWITEPLISNLFTMTPKSKNKKQAKQIQAIEMELKEIKKD